MIMLMITGLFIVGFGLVCLFDSDLAWFIHEADARIFGKTLTKHQRWEQHMMLQGFCLVVMGGIGVMLGMGLM